MKYYLLAICLSMSLFSFGRSPLEEKYPNENELIEYLRNDKIKGKTGVVILEEGVVSITVPSGYQFLDQEQTEYYFKNYFDYGGAQVIISEKGLLIPENAKNFIDIDDFYSIYVQDNVHIGNLINDSIKDGLLNYYQTNTGNDSIRISWYDEPRVSVEHCAQVLPLKQKTPNGERLVEYIIISRDFSFVLVATNVDGKNAKRIFGENDNIVSSFTFYQDYYNEKNISFDSYLDYLYAKRKERAINSIHNTFNSPSTRTKLPRGVLRIIGLVIVGLIALIRLANRNDKNK